MRKAATGIEQLPAGEFREYSPAGDCHFIGAVIGVGTALLGFSAARKSAKAQKRVAQASQLDFAGLEKTLADAKATNQSLGIENQALREQVRLSDIDVKPASAYAPLSFDNNEKIILGIVIVAALVKLGQGK